MKKKFEFTEERTALNLPFSAGICVDSLFEKFDIDTKSPYFLIMKGWNIFAGESVASNSVCKKIEKNVLYVSCSHPAYRQVIRLKEKEILKNINSSFPDLGLNKIKTT